MGERTKQALLPRGRKNGQETQENNKTISQASGKQNQSHYIGRRLTCLLERISSRGDNWCR